MIDQNTTFAVIGLGVLGGSYVEGLSKKGYSCVGIDIDESAIDYAKEKGWIIKGGTDPRLVEKADIVVSCLYPKAFVQWIKENQKYIKKNALLTDVTGVKRNVIKNINDILRDDIEFIACHPMAGKEFKGILYADASKFESANFIIVPTNENTQEAIQTAHQLAEILGFSMIAELSAEEHDKMIGFLSQLTHVIAVSLMNVTDNSHLVDYTGDSFRDLTRIAEINESMWPELFIENKDYLLNEITSFQNALADMKQMIEDEDYDGIKQKMILSTERRKKFNR
jgi:prephenate dehydrogenase